MFFTYILPLIVIIVTYAGIIVHLHRKGVNVIVSNGGGIELSAGDVDVRVADPVVMNRRLLRSQSVSVNEVNGLHLNNNGGNQSLDDEMAVAAAAALRQSAPGMIGKAKLNTIKITLTLVGVFLGCWTPYYVICLWYVTVWQELKKLKMKAPFEKFSLKFCVLFFGFF